jgi:hypothetical protein
MGPSSFSGEIDIMEARGNGPTYPAQYVDQNTSLVFLFLVPFLTEAVFAEASTMFEDR